MKKVSAMPTKGMPYLDYDQLFDGNAWKLEKIDYAGRDPKMVTAAIRNAAYRERIRVSVVEKDGELFVRADRNTPPKTLRRRAE